jgi:16S rRNA processing protein RimM
MTQDSEKLVTVAQVGAVNGIRGELRLNIFSEDPASLVKYQTWYINFGKGWQKAQPLSFRKVGSGLLIKFSDCDDRDLARRYTNALLAVSRDELPEPEAGEHYWADLEGMRVITTGNVELGVVDHLFETGANDVMVVKGERERLLPYIEQVIIKVDQQQRQITVDWDPDF